MNRVKLMILMTGLLIGTLGNARIALASSQERVPEALVEARRLELISHRPAAALPIYARIQHDTQVDGARREEALVGHVRCLLKLDRTEEAREVAADATAWPISAATGTTLKTLFSLYMASAPDSGSASMSMQARVESLITSLGTKELTPAFSTLKGLGKVAQPALLVAARQATDLQAQYRILLLLADDAVDDPRDAAGQFFGRLDQEADLVMVNQALGALVNELANRSTHQDGAEWTLVHPAESFCAMADRLATKPIGLLEEHLTELMGLRDDEAGHAFLRARFASADPKIREVAIRAGLRAGGTIATEAARAGLADPEGRIRRRVISDAIDYGRSDLFLEACRAPFMETRERAWQHGGGLLQTLDASRLADLTDRYTADLIESHGDPGFMNIYGSLRIPPLSPDQMARVLESGALAGLRSRYVIDWLVDLFPQPDAVAVLEKQAKSAPLAEHLVGHLQDEKPGEARSALLAEVIEQQGLTTAAGLDALDLINNAPDATTIGALRRLVMARDWRLDDLPQAAGRRVVSILFREPDTETADDLRHLVTRGPASLAEAALRSLPSGEKLSGYSDVVETLLALVAGDAEPAIRKESLAMLFETADPDVCRRALIAARFENSRGSWHGISSSVALFETGSDSLDWMEQFLEKASPGVLNIFAGEIMERAGRWVAAHPEQRTRFEEIVGLTLGSAMGGVRDAAWSVLEKLYPDGTVPAERARQVLTDSAVLSYAASYRRADLREEIEALLHHGSKRVRRQAVKALEALLDPRSARPLIEALADPDEDVRQAARKALESIRNYLEEKERWAGFEERGEAALSPLAALLHQVRDTDEQIRLTAIRALGALGDVAALPHLIELLRSEDAAIREAAHEAIEKLLK